MSRRALIAVAVLALVVRVAVVLATPHFVPQTDSADYDREAVSLVQHHNFPNSLLAPGGPTAFRPPAFPVLLAGVYEISGTASSADRWRAGRIAEAVLGAITVLLMCLLAMRLFGAAVATLAGLIGAVYPPLVLIGSSLMSESLFVPLLLAATLCALVSRDSPRRLLWAGGCGLLVALAALTRSVGIFAALPLIVLVWPGAPRLSRRAIAPPLVLVAVLAVAMVPWTVRNADVLHSFVPVSTENGYALAGTYERVAEDRRDYPALWVPPVGDIHQVMLAHPGSNEAQLSDRLTTLGLDYIRAHPGYPFVVAFWSAVRMLDLPGPGFERYAAVYEAYPTWLATASVYVFWAIALLAVAGAVAGGAGRAPRAFWAVPGLLILATLFFSGGARYRSPADPFVLMLAAMGLLAIARRGRSGPRGHRLPSAPG